MTLRYASLSLIGMIAATVLACGDGAREQNLSAANRERNVASTQPCRRSRYSGLEQALDGGVTHLYVSGEENVELPGVEITMESSSGSSIHNTWVRLRDTASDRTIEASFEVSFERMVSIHPVPEALRGTESDAWRRSMEDAAFSVTCTRPDPSLDRLLHMEEPLRWIPGTPTMPENYTLFVESSVTGTPMWIEYLGMNHRRLTVTSLSEQLQRLDRSGSMQLLRSGHGAVVVDADAYRYAWIYVYPGGRKLRWPSVIDGRFDRDSVVLRLAAPDIGLGAQQVRIDLRTGAVRRDDGRARGLGSTP